MKPELIYRSDYMNTFDPPNKDLSRDNYTMDSDRRIRSEMIGGRNSPSENGDFNFSNKNI
jgi:hypothetical protein